MKFFNEWLTKWKQRNCEHYWRPALKEVEERQHLVYKPTKVCDYCKLEVVLSVKEFYGQFGRMPW